VNKDLLELWGQTLLEMAKLGKGPEGFFELFQNGFARKERRPDSIYEQFMELCQRTFGKDGVEKFNGLMKEFYDNAGVVPRTQYNELHEKYIELKRRVHELEEKIESLRKRLQGDETAPSELMEQWSDTVRKYAEINQQFFEQFSKFFNQ
jgi:hypothetical protein